MKADKFHPSSFFREKGNKTMPDIETTKIDRKEGGNGKRADAPVNNGGASVSAPTVEKPVIDDPLDTEPVKEETQAAQEPLPPSVPVRRPWRRWVFGAAALVLLIVGTVYGLRYWRFAHTHVSTDDAFVTGDVVQISPQ